MEHDLDLRVPHPRGRLDRGAGARVHARKRHRVLRGGGRRRGCRRTRSARGCRSSSTRTTTSSRRWRSSAPRGGCGRAIMRERFGATNPKALALRFHAQTGGSTLTAQQPENNIVRVAIQALSAVCGGAQSLHTNSFDEALALPTERAARDRAADAADPADEAGDDRHRRPARRLVLHRGADRRARGARVGADRAGRRARRRRRGGRAGFRPGRDRGRGLRVAAGGRVGRARDRRRQQVRRGAAKPADRAAGDRPGRRAAAARAHGTACVPSGTPTQSRGCARARARRGARNREPAPPDARGPARSLHDRRDLRRAPRRSGASTTSAAASREPVSHRIGSTSASQRRESRLGWRWQIPTRAGARVRRGRPDLPPRPVGARVATPPPRPGRGRLRHLPRRPRLRRRPRARPLYEQVVGHGPNDLFPYAVERRPAPGGPAHGHLGDRRRSPTTTRSRSPTASAEGDEEDAAPARRGQPARPRRVPARCSTAGASRSKSRSAPPCSRS